MQKLLHKIAGRRTKHRWFLGQIILSKLQRSLNPSLGEGLTLIMLYDVFPGQNWVKYNEM